MNTFKVWDKVRLIKDWWDNHSSFGVWDTFIIEEVACSEKEFLRPTKWEPTWVHYTYCELVEEFKVWNLIKSWDNVYKVTNDTNVAFNIRTWIKFEINNKSNFQLYEDKKLAEIVNYYFDNDWNEKLRQALNVKGNLSTDVQTNILLTNNNTMEKLNKLRADKFFANEKNLVAIESLDTLLNDSVQLIVDTENELKKTKEKLHWLNRKLEAATNNQDLAMLKDLIASTKVVQEFVDELKGKTISKFETAKTKFDVALYLKD